MNIALDFRAVDHVTLPPTGEPLYRLGIGCASLGSRISRDHGLAALEAAYEGGVRWFDVAPAYGAGEAEGILGAFLKGKPDAKVCTKVGLAPPNRNAAIKLAYATFRPVAAHLTGLRRAFRKLPATRNTTLPLTPELIEDSLSRSLARLGLDRVEAFALHDPTVEDVLNPAIIDTLRSIRSSGRARYISVAGSKEACQAAALIGDTYDVLQLANAPSLTDLTATAKTDIITVTHSVYGLDGALAALTTRLQNNVALAAFLRHEGYEPDPAAARELLLRGAITQNARGPVLLSMFGPTHLAEAQTAIGKGPLPAHVMARVFG